MAAEALKVSEWRATRAAADDYCRLRGWALLDEADRALAELEQLGARARFVRPAGDGVELWRVRLRGRRARYLWLVARVGVAGVIVRVTSDAATGPVSPAPASR